MARSCLEIRDFLSVSAILSLVLETVEYANAAWPRATQSSFNWDQLDAEYAETQRRNR